MSKIEIYAYITADEKRILSGDPLVFLVKDINEQNSFSFELGRMLKANVAQLKNGDYMIFSVD